MTYPSSYYRPSVLELAQAGNIQAIAYWMNSFLAPYGIHVQAALPAPGSLKLSVEFRRVQREQCLSLRRQVVQFICYRLWTLNSTAIQDVRIVARHAGAAEVVWKQSVRIVTPASRRQRRPSPSLAQRGAAWVKFQILRSIFISRLAVASFFLSYAVLYWELVGYPTSEQTAEIQPAQNQSDTSKGQLRAIPASEGNLAQPKMRYPEQPPTITVPPVFRGQIVYEASSGTDLGSEKVVAFTFDDGPWPNTTEQVLEILKQNNVKATFFWVGTQIQRSPDLAKKVAAAGHAIGNHTWRHPLQNVSETTAAQELGNTARLIYETTGIRTSLMRPPGGNLKGALVPYALKQQQTAVMWSVESHDYYVSAPLIVDNVLRGVRSGSIVLMHDGGGDRSATVQALPQILDTLKRQGYRFVTVPELLEMQSRRIPG
jgi:peptidoglycan/xylan/chitin deacetylase (PgdA/CDA1 family)